MKILLHLTFIILACSTSLLAQHQLESHPLYQQATEYESQNKYPEAIETINKLIELKPDEALPYLARAIYLKRSGDFVTFHKDLEKAAALAPNDISILIGIERTLGTTNGTTNREGCERVLEFADSHYSKFQQSAAILGIRARMKRCLGDVAGSFNDLSMAIELDPENANYRSNRASMVERLGSSQQALDLLQQLIDSLRATQASASKSADEKTLAKLELKSAHSVRAGIFERNGENEAALAELSNAIELNRSEHDLRTRIALYKKMGRTADAATDLSAIIEIRKDSRAFLNTITPPIPAETKQKQDEFIAKLFVERGDIYIDLGRYDEAIADYAQSLKLDPTMKDSSEKKIAVARERKMAASN